MVGWQDDLDWHNLLEQERSARSQLSGPDRPPSDAVRQWWSTVRDVLLEFEKRIARNNISELPPVEVLQVMSRLSRELSQGIIPPFVSDVAVRGNPSLTFLEARDIGIAVAYSRAAKQGIEHNGELIQIDDRCANRTIREAFGVNDSTVRAWCRKYSPGDLGVNSISAEVLISLLISAGKHYQNTVGRSHKAIAKRRSKWR